MGDGGVVGEGVGEGAALGFSQGGEIRVVEGVVCIVEVVVTLCVADAVDCCLTHSEVVDDEGSLEG